MALTQGLQVKQTQNLAMTSELQQSLKMLQLSSIDLADMINAELEKNPLLMSDDGDSFEQSFESKDSSATELTELSKNRDVESANDSLDYDYGQAYDEVGSGGNHKFEASDYDFEDSTAEEKDLNQFLVEQMNLDIADESDRKIGLYMMDYLDGAGYFTGDICEIAQNLGVATDEIERVLKSLQQLEPSGIFARNLEECLRIQLEDKNRLDPCMYTLLANLPLLGMGKLATLQELCGVDGEDLYDMIQEIKALNPKPALDYARKELTPGQPDIFIKKKDDDTFTVELNPAALPKVLVNKKYYQEVSAKLKDKEEKKYVKQNLSSANFLIKALDQRANTMLKTASAIVSKQEEFFKYGIKFLKPMTLSHVAEELGMHESTISRVTSNKYISTPRGAFEMKYFFTSGVTNSGGEVASTSVKEVIKELIISEDRNKPYSDDFITNLLKQRGINISRRTVMKYRESLEIPSSYERKNSPVYISA